MTPMSCYWLGFIYADGYLYKGLDTRGTGNNYRQELVLKLSSKDKNHLEYFANIFNIKIKDREEKLKKTDKTYFKSVCRVSHSKIIKPLFEMGLENKTYDFKPDLFDMIPLKYMNHFMRGLFDGDGCIYMFINGQKGGTVFFTMGNSDVIYHINDIIKTNCNINDGYIRERRLNNWELSWRKISDLISIYDYFYKNKSESHYMNRKYEKFNQIMNRNNIIRNY
jgi:hypothetical protein